MTDIAEIKPEPNEIIIEMLKDALEAAESGNIQSLVMIGANNDASTFNVFCANWSTMAVLGELRVTERDLIDLHVDIRRRTADWAVD